MLAYSRMVRIFMWLKLVVPLSIFSSLQYKEMAVKKKHSDPPEYFYIEFRVASHVFVSQVQWLMVIYSWVAESGYIEGAEFPWNNYVH